MTKDARILSLPNLPNKFMVATGIKIKTLN